MQLHFFESTYSVCQLDPDAPTPEWVAGDLQSVTRTADELTVICEGSSVPSNIKSQDGFACFRVVGSMEFDIIGVIAGISRVIAEANIALLSVSTYDTDYFLIAESSKETVIRILVSEGHEFV